MQTRQGPFCLVLKLIYYKSKPISGLDKFYIQKREVTLVKAVCKPFLFSTFQPALDNADGFLLHFFWECIDACFVASPRFYKDVHVLFL